MNLRSYRAVGSHLFRTQCDNTPAPPPQAESGRLRVSVFVCACVGVIGRNVVVLYVSSVEMCMTCLITTCGLQSTVRA